MAECTIYDKLRYIQETKDLIKAAIESQDIEVMESDTFRKYAEYITEIRKVSSVNGMQGDVTITIQDLGGITQEELDSKGFITAIPSEYITQDELSVQLEDKVSENGLKTINGESIVGEGDIQIEGGSNVIELTQSEYDELEMNGELQDALYLLTDVDNQEGNSNIVSLTQSEYDNLDEKVEGTLYVITDAQEITVPTKLSQLENDSNYVTKDYLNEIIGDVENKITEINELI